MSLESPLKELLLRAWLPASLVVIWYLVGWNEWVNPLLLPSLSDTVLSGVGLVTSGEIFVDIRYTAVRFFMGYGLAVIIGIPIGMFVGTHASFHKSLQFLLEFGRSTP